jgi:PIN domain nuclease of toxin-antitoxin system
VRLLLDTQVVLWALGQPERLSTAARSAIVDPDNELGVSAVTAWEVAIKRPLGKLLLLGSVVDWLLPAVEDLGATWIPISSPESAAVEALPLHHRDPFDRLLAVQAIRGAWTLVSSDRIFRAYAVPLLPA